MSAVTTMGNRSGGTAWAILRVLGWELVRRLELTYLAILLGGFLLPWAIFRGILNVPADEFDSVHYYPPFLAMNASLAGIAAFQAQRGVRQWLGARPVSTWFIFSALTLSTLAVVLVSYLATYFLVERVYGVDWPWLRPVLWLSTFVILARCTYFRIVIGRQCEIFFGFLIFLLAAWAFVFVQRTGDGGGLVLDSPMTVIEVVSLLIGNCLAIFVGYRSLVADRTNGLVSLDAALAQTPLLSESTLAVASGVGEKHAIELPNLTSKKDAICWMARRQYDAVAVWSALLASLLFAVLTVCAVVEDFSWPLKFTQTSRLFDTSITMLMFMSIAMGIGGGSLIASMIRTPSEKLTSMMSSFHAVRPIETRDFWDILSNVTFRLSVLAWLTPCVVLSAFPCIVAWIEWREDKAVAAQGVVQFWKDNGNGFFQGLRQNVFYPTFGMGSVLVWLLLTFLVVWILARLTASAMAFGNDKAVSFVVGTFCVLFVSMCFIGLAVRPEIADILAASAWMMGGVVAVGFVAWCFREAWRHQLIGRRDVVWGCCCWAIMASLIYPQFHSPYRAFGAALMCVLAAVSFAAGPLGVRAARQQ